MIPNHVRHLDLSLKGFVISSNEALIRYPRLSNVAQSNPELSRLKSSVSS